MTTTLAETESTFRTMTTEHLGPTADEHDLADFRAACERILPAVAIAYNEADATEYVWNNGSVRFEADICAYCEQLVADRTVVPEPADDDTWETLSREHYDGCEWIATRAHRL